LETDLERAAGRGDAGNSALLRTRLDALAHSGGRGGLLQKLQQGGLGDFVQPWIGTGNNSPVSPQQFEQVLVH
jgi:uncharacterized protein YidB (DUF937 family)